jgi:glycosyltransferase involved in cell wall biosynthesis
MVRAMTDLLIDPELRARMERLGAHRATLFSWQKAAERTLDVYYGVAGAPQRQAAGLAARAGR